MAITDSLVSAWKFDESSGNAADSKGSNTLTNNGSVSYSAGKIGNGAVFVSASSKYLSIADASQSGLDLSGDFTFSLWAKCTTAPSSGNGWALIGKHDGGSRSYMLTYENNGGTKQLILRVSSDGTSTNQTASTINYDLGTGTLHHIVVTHDTSGNVRFYIDGVQSGSTLTGSKTSIYNGTSPFCIGGSPGGSGYFDGQIDEVGIWSRVLSNTEASYLYNDGNGTQYPFTTSPTGTFKARFYVGTGDGETRGEGSGGGSTAWNGARNTGLAAYASDTTWNTLNEYSPGQWSNSSAQVIARSHVPVDTALLGSGASISAALLKVWVGDNYATSVPGGAPDYFIVIPGAQASTSTVSASDHALTIPAGVAWSSSVTRTSLTTSAYNTFTLNATGIAGLSKTGYSKLCIVTGGDYENYGFNSSWVVRMLYEHANSTNVDKVPYLELTWTNKTTVEVTKTARYAVKKAGNAVTKTAQYDVKRSVTSLIKTAKYAIKRVSLNISKTSRYAVRKQPSITKTARYAVGTPTAATRTARYAVKGHAEISKTGRYAVKKAGQSVTKSATYRVGRPADLAKAGTYRVRTSAGTTLAGTYRTRKTIGAVKTGRYVVKAAAAVALAAGYEIVTNDAIARTGRYAVKAPAGVALAAQYAVTVAGSSFGKTGRYAISVTRATTKTGRYAVKASVSRLVPASYQIGGGTDLAKAARYAVKGHSSVTKAGRYAVTAKAAVALAAAYVVENLTQLSKTARYAIRQEGVLSLGSVYVTKRQAAVTIMATYRVTGSGPHPQEVELTARYAVRIHPYTPKKKPYYKLARVLS